MTLRLETERLILREIHEDDARAIYESWMQDEDVSRYMWWKASNDFTATQDFVQFELSNLKNDSWNRWLIELKSTREVIGTCLIFWNEDEHYWDISYNLGKKFWGKGYVTEAMREVMKYATEVMKVKEINTVAAAENHASAYVLEKLGFEYEKDVPYECNGGDIVTTGRFYKYIVEKVSE